MNDALITVRYSCPLCGICKREVAVRARGDENVVEWLEQTCIVALGRDHAEHSPFCRPNELKDIMIPLDGTTKVGGVVQQ